MAVPGVWEVLERYRAKIVTVPGSECLWWAHAVSGRGHGRFWLAPGSVMIAHRYGFAVMHGVEALDEATLQGHRCDNPLRQRIAPGHLEVSSALRNRREWSIRRNLPDSPLADPRGPRRRARELRDMARTDPELIAADLERLQAPGPTIRAARSAVVLAAWAQLCAARERDHCQRTRPKLQRGWC